MDTTALRPALEATGPFATALVDVSHESENGAHEHELARTYYEGADTIPGVTVWGPGFESRRRAPTGSITIEGVHPQDAARALGEQGIAVWDGHFYAVRPIEVLGLAEQGGVIRVGTSMYNTQAEIERLLNAVEALAA